MPPSFCEKPQKMKGMGIEQRQRNSGRAAARQCLHEHKNELLRPQPLGCRKTIIIRRETESVQAEDASREFRSRDSKHSEGYPLAQIVPLGSLPLLFAALIS